MRAERDSLRCDCKKTIHRTTGSSDGRGLEQHGQGKGNLGKNEHGIVGTPAGIASDEDRREEHEAESMGNSRPSAAEAEAQGLRASREEVKRDGPRAP